MRVASGSAEECADTTNDDVEDDGPRTTTTTTNDDGDDLREAEADAALFEAFAAIPAMTGGCLARDPSDDGRSVTLRVATTQRDLAGNRVRKSGATVAVPVKPSPRSTPRLTHPAFGTEERGVILSSVSPSGERRLVVRDGKDAGGDRDGVVIEVWSDGALAVEVVVPAKTHGPMCVDGTFGGVSWSANEGRVVYVAEAAPADPTPEWGMAVTRTAGAGTDGRKSWRGQGEWREQWGEQLVGRVEPAVFILEVATGDVIRLEGLPEGAVAASGPVWAPSNAEGEESTAVVCPVWNGDIDNFGSTSRRLGLVFCFNRPSAMYLVPAPVGGFDADAKRPDVVCLTPDARSALWPRFTPDGSLLVFVSHEAAVESGAHMATAALRAIPWSAATGGPKNPAKPSHVVVPTVHQPEREGAFPGLYIFGPPPASPWVGPRGLVLQSTWEAGEAVVHVDVETGEVTRLTPPAAKGAGEWAGEEEDLPWTAAAKGGGGSWTLLDVCDGVVAAAHSDPATPPRVHVAWVLGREEGVTGGVTLRPGGWTPVRSDYRAAVAAPAVAALANLEYHVTTVLRAGDAPDAAATVQSITVRPKHPAGPLPTVVLPHGGPHASCPAGYVASVAYLASLGYAVVYCNYRGSTGYGEAPLQSLVGGNAGTQDVADCVRIAEAAIEEGVADPNRVCVIGGSHGGFLGAHLIGQAPDLFKCAVLRNPVTDIAAMVPLTDIPDWCFVETVGRRAYTDLPSVETLAAMRDASPVAHLSKVKAPVLMLLGAVDLRVPPSNGLRYAAALREAGGTCEVRVFPADCHGLTNPRTEFESFVTVARFLRQHVA